MITSKAYGDLKKKYGHTSSWTIWTEPKNGNWKSKDSISDMTVFSSANLLGKLNGDYIFVGLNPAKHDYESSTMTCWENFHSGDTKRSQDYKLRFALKDTEYWGSFITDLYPDVVETDSNKVGEGITGCNTKKSIGDLLKARDILGGKATIVAIGNKAYKILKKELPVDIDLKKITHYSYRIGPDKYKERVLEQL